MNKKQIAILIAATLLITSTAIITLATFSTAPPLMPPSEDSQTEKKGFGFIENVLPIDISQYNVTFLQPPNNDSALSEKYSLESDNSALDVFCHYENNVLKFCFISVKKGSVISDRPYDNLTDAAKSVLVKYQAYTKIDSTEMIDMLSSVDPTKNATLTSGNLTLTISNGEFPKGTKTTSFNWRYVYNNCEYTGLNISFDNSTFDGLGDTRGLYTIGNTTVLVSMRQAIDAAMKRIENYSYEMPGDVWISDFNVSGTSAELRSSVREPYVLYPYWHVRLILDKQYPGSVTGLLVFVWADSGEAFYCHHDSTGHKDY